MRDVSDVKPSLLKNVKWLFLIQLLNSVLPLATIPIIARALGPTEFGALTLSLAITAYACVITDFGFNLSATANISQNRLDAGKLSAIFNQTIFTKITLALSSGLGITAIAWFVPEFRQHFYLIAISLITVTTSAITPGWYYQGVERMHIIGLWTATFRLASIPLIFLFVEDSSDTALALVLTTTPMLMAGVVTAYLAIRRGSIRLELCSRKDILATIQTGWHTFLSSGAISLYTNTNPVVIGALSGATTVGTYTAADKLIRASFLGFTPASQALYPRIAFLFNTDKAAAWRLAKKYFLVLLPLTSAISIGMAYFAEEIVAVIFGPDFQDVIQVLVVLAALPVIIGLSNFFGIQLLLPLGHKKALSRTLLTAGMINLILLFILVPKYGALGAAWAVVTTELTVTLSLATFFFARALRNLKP